MAKTSKWNPKCKFFNEKYACDTLTNENYKSCSECKFSSLYTHKILIIKLGALGDVLRTTPLLESIRNKYPESVIYWLVEDKYGEGKQLLENNPYIDKVLVLGLESVLRLQQEKFDIVYSLEIDTPGTLIANVVKSKEKYGFFFDEGATSCFNKGAEEYLETAFLTHVKMENRKSYQELIFKACELPYNKEEIIFEISEKDKEYQKEFMKKNKISQKDNILGLNFGSGKRWPSKAWSDGKVKEFVKAVSAKYKVLLLGGPDEKEKIQNMKDQLKKIKIEVLSNDFGNTIGQFASIIDLCKKVVTTDSMALHLSASLKKPTVALFFSTPDWEIEGYGRIKKISSPLMKKHFFSNRYSEELANSISYEQVLQELEN